MAHPACGLSPARLLRRYRRRAGPSGTARPRIGLDRDEPRLPGDRLDDAVHQPAEADKLPADDAETGRPTAPIAAAASGRPRISATAVRRRAAAQPGKPQSEKTASRSARAEAAWRRRGSRRRPRPAPGCTGRARFASPNCSSRYPATTKYFCGTRKSISPPISASFSVPTRSNRRDRTRAPPMRCGRAARSRREPIWSSRPHLPDAPFDALPAAQQRAEINQQGDERARLEAVEARVDRRLARAVDAHDPGDQQRHRQQPQPAAADDAGEGQRQRRRHSTRRSAAGTRSARRAARTSSETGRGRTPRNRSPAGATAAARSKIAVDAAEPLRLAEQIEAKGVLRIDAAPRPCRSRAAGRNRPRRCCGGNARPRRPALKPIV